MGSGALVLVWSHPSGIAHSIYLSTLPKSFTLSPIGAVSISASPIPSQVGIDFGFYDSEDVRQKKTGSIRRPPRRSPIARNGGEISEGDNIATGHPNGADLSFETAWFEA